MLGHPPQHQPQQQNSGQGRMQTQKEKLQAMMSRASQLKQAGHTPETSQELAGILKMFNNFQAQQAQMRAQHAEASQQPEQPITNGHAPSPMPNGSTPAPASPSLTGPLSTSSLSSVYPPRSQTPVSFTDSQIHALRSQIKAFKLISRGQPVPPTLRQEIRVPNQAIPELEKALAGQDAAARVVDGVVKIKKAEEDGAATGEEAADAVNEEDIPKGPFLEDEVNSGIYPHNAFKHPFTNLRYTAGSDPKQFITKLQRLLVPSAMPLGIDAHQILNERDRFIESRVQQRIRELEVMPSTIGDGGFQSLPDEDGHDVLFPPPPKQESDMQLLVLPIARAHGKLGAMIELKGLKLLDKQRAMRALVSERLTHGSLLPLNRADFRRVRKPTIRDARMTEQLERKQRADRERKAKHKHVEQLGVVTDHGKEVLTANRGARDRVLKLGRAVLQFHAHTEKEEQKRIERLAKERLRALKNDDEEAYMALFDTAKDTRIMHLLKQTDSYLDSLAQAVVAQQNESGGPDEVVYFESEEGPANEATFGATVAADDIVEDKTKVDYYAVAHKISEKVTKQPTILIGGTLKEYQIKGLQWMVSLYNNRLNGILADEMGLGKTIQTISLITFLIETKKQRGPYLVIVPLSTMTNWSGEFAKWAPGVKIISYKGNPAQRRLLQGNLHINNFQVLLTTYEYIIKDRPVLSKMKWVHMIIDEGHRMKNTQSKLSQTLTTYYHSRHRLILTGTPLQNNLQDLWALLNFVLPKIFNSVQSFDEWFNTPFANSGTGDKIELNEEEALLIIRRLHKVLRPFLLRRLKKDVEKDLPDKVEKVIKVRMSALQSQLYKQMKKHKMIADGKDSKGKAAGVKGLSNELMQLRKICQHPFLFESVEDRMNPGGMIDEKLIRSSGKLELLSRILPKFFVTGHRVLIFFQMTKVMDIMEDFMKMMNYQYLRLDGGTKTEERASYVQLFNKKDSEIKVFILSTRAGGLGLNLQTADTVIIFDSDWNPHADLQAQDRAHRIGQTKAVRILRFITEKSVEEAMYARARFKLDIDDKVIQAGRFDNKSTQEEQEEFLRSILEADQEEENEEAGDMNDDELNEMLARDDNEAQVFRDYDITRERQQLEAWRAAGNRGKPPAGLMQFEELPQCYQVDEPFEVEVVLEGTEGRGQRKRNTVVYNDGLDDDQWAMALEDGEDIEDIGRKRGGRTARVIEDTSNRDSPMSESESRGRKGKSKTNDYEPVGGKRKRGAKAISVTPSLDDDDDDEDRDTKRQKTKAGDVPAAVRDRMKKVFLECHKAAMQCEDDTGRKRCELFKELPAKRDYPDYYKLIKKPIALSHIRKRIGSNTYKTAAAYKDDWRLMFNNARTYNQEGSWVYIDAEEMEKAFESAWARYVVGSGLPGAPGGSAAAPMGYDPMDDDDQHPSRPRSSANRKTVISDDDDDYSSDED